MSKRKYKIDYDRGACIGAAACDVIAPNVFLIDSEGKATIKLPNTEKTPEKEIVIVELDPVELEQLKNAAEACPVNIIHIIDVETGEKII